MRRRTGFFVLVATLMVPLSVAATAWACASLALVKMDSKVVRPGQTVQITGSGFSVTNAGPLGGIVSPVSLRLKSRTGRVLKEIDAAASGSIATSMTISDALAPGYYVLLATQTAADGSAKAGTPARYPFRVAPVAGGATASPWRGAPDGPRGFGAVDGVAGQTLLIGGIGTLALLAAGFVLVGRRNQRTTLSGTTLSV